MMKYVITLLSLTLLHGCGQDMPKECKNCVHSVHRTVETNDSASIRHFDSLLTIIGQSQNEVLIIENHRSIKKLVNLAFDTSTGCFYAVGKGLINPEFPAEAQNKSRMSAAKLNGQQWALCLKAWNSGKTTSRTKPPSGEIFYCKSLYEKNIEDTLFILFEIPAGSIRLSIPD
jgi:hypothetical protein